jgi:hypothetical protein
MSHAPDGGRSSDLLHPLPPSGDPRPLGWFNKTPSMNSRGIANDPSHHLGV